MRNFTLTILAMLCLIACKKRERALSISDSPALITKFLFTKANNPSLTEDVEGTIVGTTIKVVLNGVEQTHLRADLTYDAASIDYNGGPIDLSKENAINLTGRDGKVVKYTLKVIFRDIYIANYEHSQSRTLAVYWKNGKKVKLTDPLALHLSEVGWAMFVKDNDVYVAGTATNSNEQKTNAVYWKNGLRTELTNGPGNVHAIGWAKAIKVAGNDVYVMGTIFYPGLSPYGINVSVPVYWKNGVLVPLTDGKSIANNTSMFIHQNHCYITGYIKDLVPENYRATYWKNGIATKLTDGSRIAVANALTVVNNDVHVVGTDDGKIAHWKNGNKTVLGNGMAFSIEEKSNDFYIGAYGENNKGTVWKNGTLVSSINDRAFGLIDVDGDSYLLASRVISGSQQFLFYFNNREKPTMIAQIEHVEAEDIPHAFVIKNR